MNREFIRERSNALALCATLIVVALILAWTVRNRNRSNDVITVTGATQKDFISDLIEWKVDVVRRSPTLKAAFDAIRSDTEQAKEFFTGGGVKPEELVTNAVAIEREFETEFDVKGGRREKFKGFKLTQTFRIESPDVDKVEKVSREVSSLINAGIEVYSTAPNYYYTKLGELKITMIADATKDGRLRAEQIAKNSGGKLDELRYSSMGVFQITGRNTNADYSWGGSFDTQSKAKTASITVKLQFAVH